MSNAAVTNVSKTDRTKSEAAPVDPRLLQQREIIRQHIIHENSKNWDGVAGTFTPDRVAAFYLSKLEDHL